MEKKSRVLYFTQTVLVIIGLVLMSFAFLRADAAVSQITFSADSETVLFTYPTILNWETVDAQSCEAFGDWSGDKSLSGSETMYNTTADHTYGLRCFGDIGEITEEQVTVTVIKPPTLDFETSSFFVDYNTPVTLTWNSTYADTCTAHGDWQGDVGTSGTYETPNLISYKHYYLSCEGPAGVVERHLQIEVGSPIEASQLTFVADTYYLEYEQATTLSWNSTNVAFCEASGSWSGSKSFNGTYDTGILQDSQTYILECSGSGGSVTKIINITVASKPTFPVELDFTADDYEIDWGTSANLQWVSTYADSCNTEGTFLPKVQPTSGSYNTGTLYAAKTYSMKCVGEGGTKKQTITIVVGPNPNPMPTLDFNADQTSIEFNTSTNLVWSAENADTMVASLDWSGTKTLAGSYNTGNLIDNKHYGLEAEGPGGTNSKVVDIIVGDSTEPPIVDFWADDYFISYNAETSLHWNAEFADACSLQINSSSQTVTTNSNYDTGNLTDDLTATLSCSNVAGTKTVALLITVSIMGDPPDITVWADSYEVAHNSSTEVYWTTVNADLCRWDDIGEVGVAGSRDSGKVLLNDKTLYIQCIGPGGVSDEYITIEIIEGSGYSSAPWVHVWADETVFYGEGRTNVHWEATNAEWCESFGYWGVKPIDSSGTIDTGDFHENRTYGVTCGNNAGTGQGSVTLTITEREDVVLDFWADETEVGLNGYTNLNWYGRDAIVCQAYGNWSSSKAANVEAFETVGPLDYYYNYYYLYCWNWTSSDYKYVYVYAGSKPPAISFNVPYQVAYNTPAFLNWNVTEADYCTSWTDNSEEHTWTSDDKEFSGSQFSSYLRRTTKFYLECSGPGGTVMTYRTVSVGSSFNSPPSINLWASDYVIESGGEATLYWKTEGTSSYCRAYSEPYNTEWSGYFFDDYKEGSKTITPSNIVYWAEGFAEGDLKVYEYTFWCRNAYGGSIASLNVVEGDAVIESPSVSLWADNYVVEDGGFTMLRWSSENANSCTLTDSILGNTIPISAGTGQMKIGPLHSEVTYTMDCENPGGSTTTSTIIGVGGAAPDMNLLFWADDYDISAGEPVTLRWYATNASYCEATGSTMKNWEGVQYTAGQRIVLPSSSNVFELTCYGASGIIKRNIGITVAKLIICPNPAIITKGTDYNLVSWYKKNADEDFSCEDTTGAIDVTSGYTEGMLPGDPWNWKSLAKVFGIKIATADDFFATDWASANSLFVTSAGGGSVHGVEYTSILGGPVAVTATYKETVGSANVLVLPPPITCWGCTDNHNCLSEVQYSEDGQCGTETYSEASACRSVCKKPTDWVEVNP